MADEYYLKLFYPWRWVHNVLRGLEYFRTASLADGSSPDPRLAAAVEHLRGKRRPDGTWAADWRPSGRVWFHMDDGPGTPLSLAHADVLARPSLVGRGSALIPAATLRRRGAP